MYSRSIQNLINAFSKLPSVGPRTAERFVFYLLKSGKRDAGELTLALKQLMQQVRSCDTCWDFSDQSPCHICDNDKRNKHLICVVAESQHLHAIEKMSQYDGVYHVLRGTISPDDAESLLRLKIPELIARASGATEVILALNPDLSGETTMMYLEKKLSEKNPALKITRLARGLPMGSDVQYADEITLGNALKNRIITK